MKNRDYREIRTKDGKIIRLTQRPFCDEENYSYQYGFDDVSKKRQKPIYWINANPEGIIFSEDRADNKNDWKGGFES